jgi:hypothetical protein
VFTAFPPLYEATGCSQASPSVAPSYQLSHLLSTAQSNIFPKVLLFQGMHFLASAVAKY